MRREINTDRQTDTLENKQQRDEHKQTDGQRDKHKQTDGHRGQQTTVRKTKIITDTEVLSVTRAV